MLGGIYYEYRLLVQKAAETLKVDTESLGPYTSEELVELIGGESCVLNRLPADIFYALSVHLNDVDLLNLCRSSPTIKRWCVRNHVWDRRFRHRYGLDAWRMISTTEMDGGSVTLVNPLWRLLGYKIATWMYDVGADPYEAAEARNDRYREWVFTQPRDIRTMSRKRHQAVVKLNFIYKTRAYTFFGASSFPANFAQWDPLWVERLSCSVPTASKIVVVPRKIAILSRKLYHAFCMGYVLYEPQQQGHLG